MARASVFEDDLARALTGVVNRDVVVYTAAAGEVSHLNQVAAVVRRRGQGLRLRFRHPERRALLGLAPDALVEAI